MKKTSFIMLTLAASLSISVASAQSNPPANTYSPDYLYEAENNRDTVKYDTVRRVRRNLQVDPNFYTYYDFYFNVQPQPYNYYYRSRFWNGMFRFWFPRRYHQLISQPGFVPHQLRSDHQAYAHFNGRATDSRVARSNFVTGRSAGGRVSTKRGGFGSSGSTRAQFN